jgi:PadR family transcriptional regulator, regulatory protein AphA
MNVIRLTPTSYVVLGLIDQMRAATAYRLKQAVVLGLGEFWSLPHTQLYSECQRLAEAGLLRERRESTGRRRRIYRLTATGRKALEEWRSEPTEELYELRDAGLLKLYFGADPAALAEPQLEAHRRKLRSYEQMREAAGEDAPEGALLSLEAGIGHEREYIRFWSRLRDGGG